MDKDELSDLLKKRMKLAYEKLRLELEIDRDLYSMGTKGSATLVTVPPMSLEEIELASQSIQKEAFSLTEIEEAKKIIEDMKDA